MNFKDAYHPTRGVKSDFSNLLEKFSERETVRYQPFAEVWRSMKLSYLGAGRKTEGECREFFEEVNHIALTFYLPPYNFQVRVGGLYILYGLYITQSCVPKVPIRVTFDQWKQIQEFQANARKQQHLDVEYVFQKLFCQNAFLFVATPYEVYIKPKDRDRHERGKDLESVLTSKLKEVAVSVPNVFTPEIMQQLQAIHTQYQHLKLGIAGPNAVRPDRSLAVVEDEIITNVEECLTLHRQKLEKIRTQKGRYLKRKQEESESPGDSDADDPDFTPAPKSAQARVKAQAYAQRAKQSKGRRHRNVLTQDASSSSPEKVSRRGDKTRKDPKDSQEEEEEETFLSSSVEESSENVMSPQEYLSMPTLEDNGAHQTDTQKSKKTVKKSKKKTKTQISPKAKTKSTKSKKVAKSKNTEPAKKDSTGSDKSDTGGKKPAKKKTKTKTKSPKPKAKVTPVKKVEHSVKGKRKQSVEGEVTPGEPAAKTKKMSVKSEKTPGPSGADSTPVTPSKEKSSSPRGVTNVKSEKTSPAKSFTMKIAYKNK